jgi:hypothetical protein
MILTHGCRPDEVSTGWNDVAPDGELDVLGTDAMQVERTQGTVLPIGRRRIVRHGTLADHHRQSNLWTG